MKTRKLVFILTFVLLVILAASVIAVRLDNKRRHENQREVEAATRAVGETFAPDTSPPRFSRQ